jgi:hypothetical protein
MEHSTNSSPKSSKGGWVFFLAGFVGSLILGWAIFPMLLYSTEQQPMSFNHALHMDPEKVEGIEGDTEAERCLYCHEFRADGTFVGNPKLSKCTECHDDPESPLGDTEAEKHFLTEYVANEKEIPWLVYSKQPDCVYFSHIAHVKIAEMDCRTCHGDLGKAEALPAYQANRLTGYSRNIWGYRISGLKKNSWDRMKMDDCAACHTEKQHEEDNACFVCHK